MDNARSQEKDCHPFKLERSLDEFNELALVRLLCLDHSRAWEEVWLVNPMSKDEGELVSRDRMLELLRTLDLEVVFPFLLL